MCAVTVNEDTLRTRDKRFRDQFQERLLCEGYSYPARRQFRRFILRYYNSQGRELAWRNTNDPYKIFVSEMMLQQTQVSRVIEKYELFIKRFPTLRLLAEASQRDVLTLWQGLGYNRRALFMHKSAKILCDEYKGNIPKEPHKLEALPGIGPATAREIITFVHNSQHVIIETNIRAVFIHFFFSDDTAVSDREIEDYVRLSLSRTNPRQWYYALMDYGVLLKRLYPNPTRRSVHYQKQSRFNGSDRQVRGAILRQLTYRDTLTFTDIVSSCKRPKKTLEKICEDLLDEGFIKKTKRGFALQ